MSERLSTLKKQLKRQGLDGVIISSVSQILYLSGFAFSNYEREAYLIITKEKQYLVTDGRYQEAVQKLADFDLVIRSADLPFKKILKVLIKNHQISVLGFEEDDLLVKEFGMISKLVKETKPLKNVSLRSIKSRDELKAIREACLLTDQAFLKILSKIKQGITEKELAFELEYFIKRSGAETSFDTIVAFGKNSSVPHHKTGVTKLKNQNIILLDFGVKLNNYCSDFTRTVYFGKAPSKFKKMHQTTLQAQKKAADFINSTKNPKAADADNIARSYIKSKGFPFIPHSLGHGVGLKIHEHPSLSPKSKDVLKEGMVFTIEPGIYQPGYGGVRIEDTFVLEDHGLTALTKSPKDLIEI